MPKVSLTQFIDYLLLSGPPKLRKVREIKTGPEYQPAFDFYKAVREGIAKFHSTGGTDPDTLDALADGCHPTKRAKYASAVQGLKKFIRRKEITWFPPAREDWTYEDMRVTVNPELGLEFDGKRHLIKLYFKDKKIEKAQVGSVLALMEVGLRGACEEGTMMGILDVRRAKLFTPKPNAPDLTTLLQGEAKAFSIIWGGIS